MEYFTTTYAHGDEDKMIRVFLRAVNNEEYNQIAKNVMTDADGKTWQEFIDKMREKQKKGNERMDKKSKWLHSN